MYPFIHPLWEKEPNGSLYLGIFKDYDEVKDTFIRTYIDPVSYGKNNELSVEFRQNGNAKVKDEKWHEAMDAYNSSLSHAKIGSENISLAYANRSLCFLKLQMYDKCLIDIKLANKANYPEKSKPKLEERRTFCLNKIKGIKQIESDEPKLSYQENKHFPGLANVVQMKYDAGKFDRHFVAKGDIDVGRVILVEEAFVSMRRFEDNHMCGKCCKVTMNFIACNKCVHTLYCSKKCAESDELHEIICEDGIVYDDQLVALAIRSVFLAINIFPNTQSLIEFVESVFVNRTDKKESNSLVDIKSKYRAFLYCRRSGMEGTEKDSIYVRSGTAFCRIMTKSVIHEKFKSNEEQRFLMHLMLHHLTVVNCNYHENSILRHIFLIQKHIGHSCAPNLIESLSANKSVFIVSRPIKKGDQLYINRRTIDPQYKYLWDEYGRRCKNCEICSIDNWPISLEHIKSDPDYQYLLNQMDEKQIDYKDYSKCSILKQISLVLLKKYQNESWNTELETVSKLLRKLLKKTSTVHWSKLIMD